MKTKLGISIGLLGAAAYFLGLFGGYTAVVILAGYILLFESDRWLQVSAVKAVAVCVFFSVVSAVVGLIPDAIRLIDGVVGIFGGSFSIGFISNIVALASTILSIAQKLLLLMLGLLALDQKTFEFGAVDSLISKHFPLGGAGAAPAASAAGPRPCPTCGAEIPAGTAFCGSCGSKV
ncbi:MAG: zinc ribbon domain-containing protein [Clostridiales bacterium]|nr:zinc ribbon domain-containing protein [Clostridiales bacterium]